MLFKTDFFHQRNGEGAGGDGIGHRTAGNGSHHAADGNRDFGRPASELTEKGGGQIDKELGAAAGPEKGAEGDEQKDELGHDLQRDAEDAVFGHKKGGGYALDVVSTVGERRRQQLTEKGIENEDKGDNQQWPPDRAPGGFEYQDHGHYAESNVPAGWDADPEDELPEVDININRHGKTQRG